MSETHDLTQRAERWLSRATADMPVTNKLIADLSAALVQAEQRTQEVMGGSLRGLATQWKAEIQHMKTRAEAAEAKLVQAEQEKAELKTQLHMAQRGEIQWNENSNENFKRLKKAEKRLATQEATIRQVVVAITQREHDGVAYGPTLTEWADTLSTILLPAEQRKDT